MTNDFSDLYCALDSAATTMALSSQDWSVAGDFAWLYGIFCGWPDGSLEDGDADAMAEIAARFRWDDEKVARLRRLRAAVAAFDINAVSDLADRLLPPGGEVSDQFTVLEIDPDQRNGGMVIHWSLEDAEERKTRFKDDPGGYEGWPYRPGPFGIYRRQVRTWGDGSEHYTPWSPVVSDTTEGEDSDGK